MAETTDAHGLGEPILQTVLAEELAVYEANKLDWLKEHEGEFVLIKGKEVVGFFEDRDEALTAGYARFGLVNLMVKMVEETERIYNLPNGLFF